MKWSLAVGLLLLGLQGLPPLVGPLIPDTGGVVTGVVRRADSGSPIPEAQVAVVGETESIDRAMTRATLTDVNGRFTIKDVAPGTYTVFVQAEGYFGATAEADAVARTSKSVRASEAQQADVGVLKLVAGAVISGRISDADGQPVTGATVEALKASYVRDRLAFTPVKSTKTDDLGDYRMFWLPPGAYYIRAAYRSRADGGSDRYARVFFPRIMEEDAAPPVLVRSGAEMSGVDVRVPVTPVTGVTISGEVRGGSDDDLRVSSIYVVPRDRRVLLVGDDVDMFENHAVDMSRGRFEIRNVPPGEYNLFPQVRDREQARTVPIPVDIDKRDLANISATLEPTFDLTGSVTLDGDANGREVLKDSLQLVGLEWMPGIGPFAANLSDSGEFTAFQLPAGKYELRLASAFKSSDTYISDLKRGDTSVFDSGLTVGGKNSEPLEVMLKSKGGRISGTVSDITRLHPFPYATVVLIPERTRRQNLALYKQTLSAEDGTFTFTGILPGDYKLFAWASLTPGAWQNGIFRQRFEDRGVEVTVLERIEKRIDLSVIP
jgi:protocatechuate 3,4-dioxygenase beta subunit